MLASSSLDAKSIAPLETAGGPGAARPLAHAHRQPASTTQVAEGIGELLAQAERQLREADPFARARHRAELRLVLHEAHHALGLGSVAIPDARGGERRYRVLARHLLRLGRRRLAARQRFAMRR